MGERVHDAFASGDVAALGFDLEGQPDGAPILLRAGVALGNAFWETPWPVVAQRLDMLEVMWAQMQREGLRDTDRAAWWWFVVHGELLALVEGRAWLQWQAREGNAATALQLAHKCALTRRQDLSRLLEVVGREREGREDADQAGAG
jgi:hypothetical protein